MRQGRNNSATSAKTAASFTDAVPAAAITSYLAVDLAGEEGMEKLTVKAPVGENGDGEGGAIKISSTIKTHPYSRNLIETKKAVPYSVIVVVIKLLFILDLS